MINKHFSWLPKLISKLDENKLGICADVDLQDSIKILEIEALDWDRLMPYLVAKEFRFSGLWGEQTTGGFTVNGCFEYAGDYLIFRAHLKNEQPSISSIAYSFPAASRFERHCHDLLGINFTNASDNRRWTRHQAWQENEYPLRQGYPKKGYPHDRLIQGDSNYPFASIEGDAVYEIPVGPVHAGIIEPGHFRFQAMGEVVLNLEERLGYVHKGIEKVAVGRDVEGLLRLAGRVSGDSTVAYAWSACMALENIAGLQLPKRALYIRAILAERERIINHIGDIGAVCNDVGYSFAMSQFGRLREMWQRRSQELFGHRLMMDTLTVGGVSADLNADNVQQLLTDVKALRGDVYELFAIQRKSQSLRDRFYKAGFLSSEVAKKWGCLGFVGRASGLGFDLRFDNPYPPYDTLDFEKATSEQGDVQARVVMRAKEIYASLNALTQLLENLPDGDIKTNWCTPKKAGEGVGVVEGWRGEVFSYINLSDDGTVLRYFPRDPSWFNWPALEALIHENIVPDFPVCNKSINGSYSGHDL